MTIIRHAPDPLLTRDTLCGAKAGWIGRDLDKVAVVGDRINCKGCQAVVNMALKCIDPGRYLLAREP